MPQYSIGSGRVEAERHHLVVPLDAVDGQLPLGGGGGHVGWQGGEQAQGPGGQDGPRDGQVSFAEQKQRHKKSRPFSKRAYAGGKTAMQNPAKKDGPTARPPKIKLKCPYQLFHGPAGDP